MPYKEKPIEKRYYAIGEVADMFKVAPSLIRFWEGEFPELHPKKNTKGNRQFTKDDIETLRLIYHLVKERGFTLQGARDVMKADGRKAQDEMEAIARLERVRGFLVEMKDQLTE